MNQIFGEFDENLPVSVEGLTIVFSPTSVSLKQRWRNNGLSADFMADYFATFFTGNNEAIAGSDTQTEVKSAVSFIANELLENAMKFNDETSPHPIGLRLQMHNNQLVFLASNSVVPQEVSKFQAFIEQLTTSDPAELYISKLEANAENESESQSGVGLLTMINDYQARLGWKFETIQENTQLVNVTTMVTLIV